jgi:benzoyl-CoA reductase subunit D
MCHPGGKQMITAGVDIGAETAKVVILRDGQVLSYSVVLVGIDMKQSTEQALGEALHKAGITIDDVKHITATGTGRKHTSFAHDQVSEIIADAKGAAWLFPTVRTVIDVGAEESRGIKCDAEGKVLDFARNEKCAAGTGTFVEAMAKALELKVEEMGELSLLSQKEIPINVTCVIFAESEVVSLIHSGANKVDIAQAIHNAIATRTVSMVRRIGIEKDVVFIGGVAKNIGVAALLGKHLGIEPLIPENPQIAGALGAALIAREKE